MTDQARIDQDFEDLGREVYEELMASVDGKVIIHANGRYEIRISRKDKRGREVITRKKGKWGDDGK